MGISATMKTSSNFEPELLGRCETGLPPVGAKTNELIAKQIQRRGFVLL